MNVDGYFWIKLWAMSMPILLVCGWIYHQWRHNRREGESMRHEMRIVKMESYPSQHDRLDAVEKVVDQLQKEMNALKTNPITGGTLRAVHRQTATGS